MKSDRRSREDRGAPRPLGDKELEAVAGGVGVWKVTFTCCGSSYTIIALSENSAIGLAAGEHNDEQTHNAGSYSVSRS